MPIIDAIGVSGVAAYCGVNPQTVYGWLYRHGPGSGSANPLPEPVCRIFQGKNKKNGEENAAYGWRASDLPDIRVWYAKLRGWDMREAAHRWVEVDAELRDGEHSGLPEKAHLLDR